MTVKYLMPSSPSSGIHRFPTRAEADAWITEVREYYPEMPYSPHFTIVERGDIVEVSYFVGSAD